MLFSIEMRVLRRVSARSPFDSITRWTMAVRVTLGTATGRRRGNARGATGGEQRARGLRPGFLEHGPSEAGHASLCIESPNSSYQV